MEINHVTLQKLIGTISMTFFFWPDSVYIHSSIDVSAYLTVKPWSAILALISHFLLVI